ncbi:MAG TPA: hypothetical protein ENK26_00865 [Gammaproteobacteria bacterium]|nr:hypothetical protein [Gammaproteobacteria bacterium]
MNDWIVWIIIAAFYAPLHFLLPALIVFLSADSDEERRRGIRAALVNAALSMAAAFALVILLVSSGYMLSAMLLLFLSMLYPVGRALLPHRRWRQRRLNDRA